ncbi:hypothetical protein Q0590_08500 [Rhodocytophaga aerolata]|uniref:Uncharacterized protein n=1 Tax=Rhodocytophaga aerolata TaxID=455078 RepID=A0ABT8R4G5_9BACT|nr:hypothetical protein [Rhodocytophaga aerolata]MDO1446289.1 hypothetical protein [Rhodocytophaga aerolata]
MSDYREYYKLTPYQRQCLPATNFWRKHNKLEPIAIPPDEHLPLVCGSETKQEETIIINESAKQTAYMDFKEVEKPVLRERKRAFSMMEFIETEG